MNPKDAHEPTREEIDATPGPLVLEFGAEWCEFCEATRPMLASLLKEFPAAQHIRIEDGKGKPLGRSFRVKLWPTIVFLRNGRVLRQAIRPTADELRQGLEELLAG
jgi:thioredoxin 1